MPDGKPYLHDFFKQGNKPDEVFKFRVYTLPNTEVFEIGLQGR